MSDDPYREVFRPLVERLEQIPHAAWADLEAWIPEAERGDIFPIPRAGFIQWRMIVHAQNIFGTNGPIRMVKDSDGLHFLYIENCDNPYGVEFGKAGDGLCRRKNSNGKNSMMLGQMSFWFLENEPKRFSLVHTVAGNGLSSKIGKVALTIENHDGVEWRWLLSDSTDKNPGEDFDIPMRPADPSEGPAAPTIVPKIPSKEAGEQRRGKKDVG